MFWGLILQPGKRYSSTVNETFHVSAATVDTKSVGKTEIGVFPVQVKVDGQELILCNLSNQCLQKSLDLYFDKGSELTFMTTGKAIIHLTGYTTGEEDDLSNDEYSETSESEDAKSTEAYKEALLKINQKNKKKGSAEKRKQSSSQAVATKKARKEQNESSEDSSDLDQSGDSDLDDFSFSEDNEGNVEEVEFDSSNEGDEEEDEDDDDDDSDMSGDLNDDHGVSSAKKEAKIPTTPKPNKESKSKKELQVLKKKQEKTPGSSKKPDVKQDKSNTPGISNGTPAKSEKKEKKKSIVKGEMKAAKGNESISSTSQSPKKQTVEGGVTVEDLKLGNGPVAKAGKMITVYYTGRLKNNNRVFDQSNTGPGFKFRLSRGEVIKGWDVGLVGMKVGSKRRITCPAAMAYGAKGSPPSIPPNSTLVFDVELRSVN